MNIIYYKTKQIQMVKQVAKGKRINKNYFKLTGKQDLFFKSDVVVNFTPYRKIKQSPNRSILPTFNDDKREYTLAFSLPAHVPESQKELEIEHNKRVLESTLQISNIMMPKPRSKHKYCGVCRNHYEDYLEHTTGQDHTASLKKSHFQGFISRLCDEFQAKFLQKKEVDDSKHHMDSTTEELFFKQSSETIDLSSQKRKDVEIMPDFWEE